jgi:hypothetical protein
MTVNTDQEYKANDDQQMGNLFIVDIIIVIFEI